jgi:hypothetical protein
MVQKSTKRYKKGTIVPHVINYFFYDLMKVWYDIIFFNRLLMYKDLKITFKNI